MSDIVLQDRLVEEGVLRLAPPFWGKPRIASILVAILWEVERVERALFDVLTKRRLANATDAQLETLGRLVGEARYGRTDDAYRVAIRGRILANRSRGVLPDLVTLIRLMLPLNPIETIAEGPLAVRFDIHPAPPADESEAAVRLLRAAKPATVDAGIRVWETSSARLTLSDGVATISSTLGLCWTGDGAIGGTLGRVIN